MKWPATRALLLKGWPRPQLNSPVPWSWLGMRNLRPHPRASELEFALDQVSQVIDVHWSRKMGAWKDQGGRD